MFLHLKTSRCFCQKNREKEKDLDYFPLKINIFSPYLCALPEGTNVRVAK